MGAGAGKKEEAKFPAPTPSMGRQARATSAPHPLGRAACSAPNTTVSPCRLPTAPTTTEKFLIESDVDRSFSQVIPSSQDRGCASCLGQR